MGKSSFVGLVLAALLGASPALTAQNGGEFQPHVGQEGKDVIWVPTPRPWWKRCSTWAR